MDPLQQLLDRFRPSTEAESLWLKNIFTFISEHLRPVACSSAPSQTGIHGDLSLFDLSVCVVQVIQQQMRVAHSLPVSYRLLSVSELISQQHLACVSNLSWSTNQQKAWAREAELAVPCQRVLPRVNLLLIGCLREGQGGEWRLTDASGSVTCECLSPSPLWLNCPVFLPHWNYIPHDASRQEEVGGFLELIGSPVPLCPGAEQALAAAPGAGEELSRAVRVREAAGLLKHRVKGQRLSMYGQVGVVCPLLVVAGTTFFCFTLTDESRSLPILIKDSSQLSWAQRVCVGQSVCVTALRVCVLRGWRGNNILCVTEHSQLHADYTHTQENAHTESLVEMSQPAENDSEEAEPEEGELLQSGVRMKQSRVINYQGIVTEVVSEGAGLYLLDGKVGLCVAYQPSARRKLRAGDRVELHHVHFLYRPCPDFPPSMLCTCLRSSLRVTEFSRVGGSPPDSCCPGDGTLPRLLLQKNTGVSEYLWACHLSSQLARSLVSGVWRQQCVCLLSWRLMETLRSPGGRGRRDIYSEMLDEPHTCPLTQYSTDPAVHQYLSVSELLGALQADCWSSVSLSSLLPPDGSSLTTSQINCALSWSCRTLSSDPQSGDSLRRRPLLLVGVMELPSQTSELKQSLQLRDATGAVACVVTENDEEGGQRASFNSAWIGCLVGVVQFTMVTERFLQSDFPSHQHLDQDRFITHKHCRVYLQFSLDHVHILSPSVAMEAHLRHQGEEPGEYVSARKQKVEEKDETAGRKRRRKEEAGSSHSGPCVSMVVRVEQKEGVTWRNTGVETKDQEAGLRLCFSLRAAVIGPVVSWERDPKNEPMTEREREQKEEKVVLVFSGVCARWFPVLQPGSFYRLIAANTQDPSILIGCGITGRSGVELHADSTLQVRRDWRFHTLTRPLLLPTCRQAVPPTVLSVSEVLDCSSELVCFQGLVSERISVNNRTTDAGHTHSGMRLTLCDQTGRSLQVYLDLSHTPYPPGLLPGNTLLLSGFQRRLSRTGSVYFTYLPVSSMTVVSLGDTSSACPPPAPIMHLGQWALSSEQRCTVGQVKGHVVCCLFLQLQWSCSLCGSVYRQVYLPFSFSVKCCEKVFASFQTYLRCVNRPAAALSVVRPRLSFSPKQSALVRPLMGLTDAQWEGLQRALRVRGHVRVYPRGQSQIRTDTTAVAAYTNRQGGVRSHPLQVCDGDSDDFLLHFLLCVCSSDVMNRPLSLTCRKHTNRRPQEVRKFTRGDRDFLTRLTPPLQLTCLHLHPD